MAFIADVFDATIIDNDTGEVAATTTLTSGNLNFDMAANEVRSGKGNPLRALLRNSRDVTAELQDTDFSYRWLAAKLGKPITTGSTTAYSAPKWYEVSGATPTITLETTPTDNSSIAIEDEDGEEISTFTVSGATITFSGGAAEGDHVLVKTFKYNTSPNAQKIEIDTTTVPASVKLILRTIEIAEDERPLAYITYIFDRCVFDGTFTVETASERTASNHTSTLRVLKPKFSDVIGKVIREPIS